MTATKEYLKLRTECNIAHTKFLFATKPIMTHLIKDTIGRWVKNTLRHRSEYNYVFISYIVSDHLPAVRPIIWALILTI